MYLKAKKVSLRAGPPLIRHYRQNPSGPHGSKLALEIRLCYY